MQRLVAIVFLKRKRPRCTRESSSSIGRSVRFGAGLRAPRRPSLSSGLPLLTQSRMNLARSHRERSGCRPPAERLTSDMGALRRDLVAATARPAVTAEERKGTADDLVGLEGTLCSGPCEDLSTIDPKELGARHEAARA